MPICFSLLNVSPTQLEVTALLNSEVSDEPLLAIMPANIDGKIRSQVIRSDEVLVVTLSDILNDALSSPDRNLTSRVLGVMQHFMNLYAPLPAGMSNDLVSARPAEDL